MTIPTNSPESAWTAFFVQAVSPGQVLRILERMARTQPDLPTSWLLSSPTQPQGYRVLLAQPPQVKGSSVITLSLNRALEAPVCVLQVTANEWSGMGILQPDQPADPQGGKRSTRRGLLGLLKASARSEPWDDWARTYGLPVQLLTDGGAVKQGQKVAYRTVAKLDQRSLLVERVNTWYELTLGEV